MQISRSFGAAVVSIAASAMRSCFATCVIPAVPLHVNERPPAALVSFVAEQIDVPPEAIDDYLASEQNRRRHAAELQDRLRLRPFGTRPAAELMGWLLPHAIENDRLAHLAELTAEECRRRRIVVPPPRPLERLCVEVPYRARREIQRRLTDGWSVEKEQGPEGLRHAGRKPARAGSPGCARCQKQRSLSRCWA